MTQTWIAEIAVVLEHPDGRREPGKIAVGAPVRIDAMEAHCMAALEGFFHQPFTIAGSDTMQALLLALRFLGSMLHTARAQGIRVLDAEEDAELGLETYFGPLLRAPQNSEPPDDDDTP